MRLEGERHSTRPCVKSGIRFPQNPRTLSETNMFAEELGGSDVCSLQHCSLGKKIFILLSTGTILFPNTGPVHYCKNGYGTLFIPKGYDFRIAVTRERARALCAASEGNFVWRSAKSMSCARDFLGSLSSLFHANYNLNKLWWGGEHGSKLERKRIMCFLRKPDIYMYRIRC